MKKNLLFLSLLVTTAVLVSCSKKSYKENFNGSWKVTKADIILGSSINKMISNDPYNYTDKQEEAIADSLKRLTAIVKADYEKSTYTFNEDGNVIIKKNSNELKGTWNIVEASDVEKKLVVEKDGKLIEVWILSKYEFDNTSFKERKEISPRIELGTDGDNARLTLQKID